MGWQSKCLVGIPEIDEQHRQLFECIDRLEGATDGRQRELAAYYVIDELKDYARIHFAVEEIVMRLFDYPGLAAHAAEHREFEARLKSLGKIELAHDIHAAAGSFLRDWLTNHIMVSDKRYADFILGQRASGARASGA
jgi:hemerythrin